MNDINTLVFPIEPIKKISDLWANDTFETIANRSITINEVREIVQEELLEFKVNFIRADTLFQKILKEIRQGRGLK